MAKSLNDVLTELGYATELACNRHVIITKGGDLIGTMSAGQVWNYLRNQHPEYFKEVN